MITINLAKSPLKWGKLILIKLTEDKIEIEERHS